MGHMYIHRGPESGCKMVTLFDSYSCDDVSAGIWVIHTEVANLGVVSDTFWRVLFFSFG